MGASNVQIGVLAALPTLTNIFQLVSVWLVQKFNNRRAITVTGAICARFPLLLIGILPLLFSNTASVGALIFLLSFQYLFASIAGGSWNSWMRDLIPQQILGSYFSHRSRLMQILNVTLSLFMAMSIDHIKGTLSASGDHGIRLYVHYQWYSRYVGRLCPGPYA